MEKNIILPESKISFLVSQQDDVVDLKTDNDDLSGLFKDALLNAYLNKEVTSNILKEESPAFSTFSGDLVVRLNKPAKKWVAYIADLRNELSEQDGYFLFSEFFKFVERQ